MSNLSGAGVVGSSIALELSRAGLSVVSVDSGGQPGAGSTSYSSGIIRTFYSQLHSVQLAHEGLLAWREWPATVGAMADPELGYAAMRACGGAVLNSLESAGFVADTVDNHRRLGLPCEEWDLAQLRDRMPGVETALFGPPKRMDDDAFAQPTGGDLNGAAYFPDTGYVADPMLATANLASAAKVLGARIMHHTVFNRLAYRDGRVAGVHVTSRADGDTVVEAPIVVNAAGPWSSGVTAAVFDDPACPAANDMAIQTRPMRTEVAYLPQPEGAKVDMVVTDFDTGVYMRPELGAKLVVGTVEPACDHPFETFPDTPEGGAVVVVVCLVSWCLRAWLTTWWCV